MPGRASTAAALLALAALALHPLLGSAFLIGHDAWIYPTRVVEFENALRDGQIPPVWAANLGRGHGQPHFQFVPPLLYWLAMPFRWLGFGLTRSIQLPLAILHGLGALAIYRLARRRRADRLASLATATAWLFTPYVALDLYVRSAYAEALAIACAPIALLCLFRLFDRPNAVRIVPVAITTALVILAHNGIALLYVGAAGALVTFRRGSARWVGMAAFGYALGLTAFSWYPAMVERSAVKIERLRQGDAPVVTSSFAWTKTAFAAETESKTETAAAVAPPASSPYSSHAIEPWQLLWSPWGFGDSRPPDLEDEMSFGLGLLHLFLGIMGLVATARDPDPARRRERWAFAVLAGGGAWLATNTALPLWDRLPLLQYLAFPWRALFLPATFLPLVATAAFERLGRAGTIAAIVALVTWNLPHVDTWSSGTLRDAGYTPEAIATRSMRASAVDEYAPRASRRIAHWPVRLRLAEGSATVTERERNSVREVYEVESAVAATAWLAPFYYPGWRVSIDGVDVPVVPARETGVLEFPLPAGRHVVSAEFGPTPVRRIALIASLVSAVMLGGFAWLERRHRLVAGGVGA